MTDREKLIEILSDFYGVDPSYFGVDAPALADHLLANGVTVQRWTPSSERLPEEGVMVLGVTKRGAFTLCRYNHRVNQWQRSPNTNIDYWMPLPTLPKE